ncbi:uncharacterized protein G2W53_000850 [Senna tora]|uniref:Uncharacterized protein n=1 Tax=Senna tora TaxID=362788 RepID=A0A835CKZ1_9FABA|nr:uncharacterized protein G2W53_000850 [Senna tora]
MLAILRISPTPLLRLDKVDARLRSKMECASATSRLSFTSSSLNSRFSFLSTKFSSSLSSSAFLSAPNLPLLEADLQCVHFRGFPS